jgi:hypothetical protein
MLFQRAVLKSLDLPDHELSSLGNDSNCENLTGSTTRAMLSSPRAEWWQVIVAPFLTG